MVPTPRSPIGGQTWDFVIADGYFGCNVSQDGTEVAASGSVDGAYEVTFSAILHPFGVGVSQRLVADNLARIQVNDDINHLIWIADPLNPEGYNAAIEAIPGGSSQIDTLDDRGRPRTLVRRRSSSVNAVNAGVEHAWPAPGPCRRLVRRAVP